MGRALRRPGYQGSALGGHTRPESIALRCGFCEVARQRASDKPVEKKLESYLLWRKSQIWAETEQLPMTVEWNLQVP